MLEAKDTILTPHQVLWAINQYPVENNVVKSYVSDINSVEDIKRILVAQAEISFKAGQESASSGLRIEADNQDLPMQSYASKAPIGAYSSQGYEDAQQDMLTPDAEGNVWVKVKAVKP